VRHHGEEKEEEERAVHTIDGRGGASVHAYQEN
jgi:hypothetical protein